MLSQLGIQAENYSLHHLQNIIVGRCNILKGNIENKLVKKVLF